jgi:hypothetical protein
MNILAYFGGELNKRVLLIISEGQAVGAKTPIGSEIVVDILAWVWYTDVGGLGVSQWTIKESYL